MSRDQTTLANDFFRQHYGRMVTLLTQYFGLYHMDLAEDLVQEALVEAMERWNIQGTPNNPEGWLMDVAKKKAINLLRRRQLFAQKIAPKLRRTISDRIMLHDPSRRDSDGMLSMIFVCCHPSLSAEAQISLVLKTLCGLSISEIADALLTTPSTIEKRLYRAKQKFRRLEIKMELPTTVQLTTRLDSVFSSLYLLFNAGYYAPRRNRNSHFDFCFEAIRLLRQVIVKFPEACEGQALLALMLFTVARHTGWAGHAEKLVILPDQDRSLWNQDLISEGLLCLERATISNQLNRYQLLAGISAEYCLAPSFADTNWQSILSQYDLLQQFDRSPMVKVNRCIALFYSGEESMGLTQLLALNHLPTLKTNALFFTTLGVLYQDLGKQFNAKEAFNQAILLARSEHEKNLIKRRM